MEKEENKKALFIYQAEIKKIIEKVSDQDYQLMARIALALYDQEKYDKNEKFWITFSALKTIMNESGCDYSDGWNNRGIASSVSAAQTKYGQAREDAVNDEEKESLEYIRHAIAVSFRNKDGEISYNPDKPDHKIQLKS